MSSRQEVKVRPGALTEGTRHRGDKGTFGGKPARIGVPYTVSTARACLVEVVGARHDPNRVKRREASALGRLALSSENPISVGSAGRTGDGRSRSLLSLTQ
jgi:hypothetical protein